MKDIILFSIRNLRSQGLRTFLTILGVIIGIAAIVAFISVGQGMQVAVKQEFEKIGSDKIIITPGSPNSMGFTGAAFSTSMLTDRDLRLLKSMRCTEHVVGYYSTSAQVKFKSENQTLIVMFVPTGENSKILRDMSSFYTEEGRYLKQGDRYAAVVGNDVAHDIFKKDIRLREKLSIAGRDYKVVGILQKIGGPDDKIVAVPISLAPEFGFKDEYSFVLVDAKDGCDMEKFRDDIIDRLKRERGKEDFKVQTSANIMSAFQSILSIIQAVFIGVAAISLFVGGIGIMNTMLMAVMERTREIGVMKAIGATNRRIMAIFLAESAAIGLAGGIMGIALGMGISAIAAIVIRHLAAYEFPVVFPVAGVLLALAFAMLTGIVSGLYPAMRAAKMNPVDALRYE